VGIHARRQGECFEYRLRYYSEDGKAEIERILDLEWKREFGNSFPGVKLYWQFYF
jgi:hypothetical protein